jgi:hypothetical protein
MKRTLLAILSALVSWMAVATVLNLVVRHALPGYAAAEPTFAFTLAMMVARLLTGAASSLAAGAVAAWIAPREPRAPWIAGIILLLGFLYIHVQLWQRFPVWYHLTFLLTLVPLVLLGARLAGRSSGAAAERTTA